MLRCSVLAFEKLDPNQSLEVALLLAQTSLLDNDHPKDISGEILYSPIITKQWYDKSQLSNHKFVSTCIMLDSSQVGAFGEAVI